MNTRANIFLFAASLRWLAGALAVVLLAASLLPIHASARPNGFDDERTALKSLVASGEDQSGVPDELPGQIACHCQYGISTLPSVELQSEPLLSHTIRFSFGSPSRLLFSAQAPPVKPPRI